MALLWTDHEHHQRAWKWLDLEGVVAVCPIAEIGFLRISTQPAFGATVAQARQMLRDWKAAAKPDFVPCDLDPLKTVAPATGTMTTDFYLAALADHHGMKLATLESNLGHPAALTIPA